MNRSGEKTSTGTTNTRDQEDQITGNALSDKPLESSQVTSLEHDKVVTDSTPTGQTDAIIPTSESTSEDSQDRFKLLSAEVIAHLGSFLDFNSLIQLLQVDTSIKACLLQHLIKPDFWREKLLEDFHIPLEISDTFLFPHLVHERLTTLANHPSDDELNLFRKIRYAFSAPGYDPFSMPWLFYPFTADSHDRFIRQLNEDGQIFQAYYLDMGCRVGNLAFVQFMVRKYGFKLNSERLKYACKSGNIALVKLFTEKYNITPSQNALTHAAMSGNVSLVEYLTIKFKFQPNNDTLDDALLSGNLEAVDYLRDNYQLGPGVNALDFAITGGNTELVMSLPANLNTEHLDFTLSEKTMSLKLVEHLIEKRNFKPTQKTLDKALAGVHHDLIEFLITTLLNQQPEFKPDFSHCALSGKINFVKRIIDEKNQTPELSWLLCAIFSGNVLLVKYLIETYSLDPKKIDLWRFVEPHIMMEPYVFCHVPMAKFLIEEHGCIPIEHRFEDYIRGKNLPLARYLITECGFQLEDDLLREMTPDNPIANIFLDGGGFENFIELGHRLRLKALYYTILCQYRYQEQLSANPLLCAFRMKESYRFEQLHPECDLSASGRNSHFSDEPFHQRTFSKLHLSRNSPTLFAQKTKCSNSVAKSC